MVIARALVAMGGSATLPEVYSWIDDNGLRRAQVPPEGMTAEQHYRREVRFARQELAEGGLLVSVGRRWQIADRKRILAVTPDAVREMVRENRRNREARRGSSWPEKEGFVRAAVRPSTASTGPTPVEWSGEVTRTDGPAETYALRFGDTDLWKIGYSADAETRLATINRHIPVEVVNASWVLARRHRWPNQLAAYSMEQEVLAALTPERTVFERVRCAPDRLAAAWDRARATIAVQQPVPPAADQPDVSTRARPKASRRPTTR